MIGENFKLTTSSQLGCANGVYKVIEASQVEKTDYNVSQSFLFVSIGVLAAIVIFVGYLLAP